MSDHVSFVDDASFEQDVVQSATPVLVDFYADWCAPCVAMSPILETIAEQRDDLTIVKLDIDASPNTAARFGVTSIPTLLLFDNGEPIKSIVGAMPRRALDAALDAALTPSG